jgi:hypothetical protein
MSVPLPPLLSALRPHLSGLVDDATWRNLAAIGEGLPPISSSGCFELRLGAADARVDFLISVQRSQKRALAEALAGGGWLPPPAGVRPVLEDWVDDSSQTAERAPAVWLEYDVPDPGARPPFLYLVLDRSLEEPVGEPISPGDLIALIRRTHRLLTGSPAAAAQVAALEHCARTLPTAGGIAHLAVLKPSRPTDDVRLVVRLPHACAAGWLREIAWPGELRSWEHALATLGIDDPLLQLNLDVGEAVRPLLGLETALLARPEGSNRSALLLQRLASAGAAHSGRAAAALAWIGQETLDLAGLDWPVRIQRKALIKLVLDAGGGLAAKAYLFFRAGYALL